MHKRINKHPFNTGCLIMYNEFPKEFHEELGTPGIFNRKANVKVYRKQGEELEMDTAYIVNPDFKTIFEEMDVNTEYQATPLSPKKIKSMGDYVLQQIHDNKKAPLSVVASQIKKEKHVQEYAISPSLYLRPLFPDLGREDNRKRLNKLKNKLENNEKFTTNDQLNLGIITVFAQRDEAEKITEEVIEIYNEIKPQLSKKMDLTLNSVISAMVDAHCKKEKDYQRLMKMIQEETYTESEEFESFDLIRQIFAIQLEEELEEKEREMEKEYETKIKSLEDEIIHLKNELKSKEG